MQQPQEWKPDKSRGPSVAKVFAGILGVIVVIALIAALF